MLYLTISVLALTCFGQKWLIKFDDVTQGSHAHSQDGGNNCISLTYKFKQFVSNRFYETHAYFDLLNVAS